MTKSHSLLRPQWPVPETVEAFSTTRNGGISEGAYGSFNVGDHVGDCPSHVAANRQQLPHHTRIAWLQQTHSNTVIQLPAKLRSGDAAYTSEIGVVCAVMTADCVPILMSDRQGNTIAAIHAGLKGLCTQIILRTIERAYSKQSGNELLAWIGPHIGPCHYEVSAQDADIFTHIDAAVMPSQNVGKVLLNLELIARQQLLQSDITSVFSTGDCTYHNENQYFSYRRARHQGMTNCGRMVSGIIKHA